MGKSTLSNPVGNLTNLLLTIAAADSILSIGLAYYLASVTLH